MTSTMKNDRKNIGAKDSPKELRANLTLLFLIKTMKDQREIRVKNTMSDDE